MAKLTYAEQQRLARRTGDITKLQTQYARSVEDYTAAVGTKEAAFKVEMDKYNTAYAPYQAKATAYQTRLADYQRRIDQYQKTPETVVHSEIRWAKGTPASGQFYKVSDLSKRTDGGYRPPVYSLQPGEEFINMNSAAPDYGKVVTRGHLQNPGAFTEKFDDVSPIAPDVLDISAEKAKLQGEKDYTSREVDERSKARLRAVQRGNARPMLSAGTNISGGTNG